MQRVSYQQLALDLERRDENRGYYSLLFDAGPDDCFRQYTENATKPWKRVSATRFVPWYEGEASKVWVTWRRAKGAWVIEAIAAPFA